MKKIWICAGTAGELIKLYPVIRELNKYSDVISWSFLFTGQSPVNFRRQWDDFNLGKSNFLSLVASKKDLRTFFEAFCWFIRGTLKPTLRISQDTINKFGSHPSKGDIWLVHGDTLSTLMGALWCRAFKGRLAHVEAGLRSESCIRPFPEEITRRIVSRLTQIHFPQDDLAMANLKLSRARGEIILTNGNTLYDSLQILKDNKEQLLLPDHDYVLANIHRNENLTSEHRWPIIVRALCQAAEKKTTYLVLHPPTENKLNQDLKSKHLLLEAGVKLLPRLIFSQFIAYIYKSSYLISDGGSNQEECSYIGKPCLILRTESERVEGLNANCVLSRFDEKCIQDFIANPLAYEVAPMFLKVSPSSIIVKKLLEI